MLTLDSLELVGFKSFADKGTLTFSGNITAIIGPNGCGKSNLADAIGWVLGAHTARNLRGQKMDDLIFSGTQKRKRSGKAEVHLRLRRSGEPFLWQGTEIDDDFIEISHEFYRSGESHYLINQRRCRLMDVQNLLQQAGLGFASYALIAQGQIDSFLTARPLERRAIIEEAAGISGYKTRRRNAELKLEMAEQNLLRVRDITGEVERQLRSLKRQAAKARRYRRLKQEFREIQRIRFAMQAFRFEAQLDEIETQIAGLESQTQEVSDELARNEEIHTATIRKNEDLSAALSLLHRQQANLQMEIDRCQNSIKYHQEQILSLRSHLESARQERTGLTQSLESAHMDRERFIKEQSNLKKEEQRIEAHLEGQQENVRSCSIEIETSEAALEELREKLIQASADSASLKNLREQLEQRLNAFEPARIRRETEKSQHQQKLEEIRLQLSKTDDALARSQAEVARLETSRSGWEEKREKLQNILQASEDEINQLQSQSIAVRERLQSLEEVEISRSQYSDGVQKLLQHLRSSHNVHTGGTLADFIDTDPRFERLVEEFLDEELEYILVDTLDEAMKGLAELKTLRTGKCTFFSLGTSNGFGHTNGSQVQADLSSEPGVFGRLADLLQMKPEVEQAFLRALPARAHAVVVTDIERALQLAHRSPESTFITLEGEAMTPKGLLSASASGSRSLGLLGLKRQKRELSAKLSGLKKKLKAANRRQGLEKEALAQIKSSLKKDQDRLYECEKERIELRHRQGQFRDEILREEQGLRVIGEELERLRQDETESKDRLKELVAELNSKQALQGQLVASLSQSREDLDQIRFNSQQAQERLNATLSDSKVIQERKISLQRTLERIEQQAGELESRLKLLDTQESESKTRLKQLGEALKDSRESLNRSSVELKELKDQLDAKEEGLARCKENLHSTGSTISDLRKRNSELQSRRSQLEIEKARLETRLQDANQQCQEQLGVRLTELAREGKEDHPDLEEIEERHSQLRQRLERFGPINMTALQEYQENEERHEFLISQREDIEASIADTTRAIREINRRSRMKFNQAFSQINQNFTEVFQKLFGGGESGMRLLDEEDVLECGIDVFAQPPGKRLQNVMLLSGGEKAMTVFALLVALFMYRPSRFCLLDEVDAPLDDANVKRFCDLLKDLSQTVQLIVITHNKRTMEVADALYGVTMEEAGVSKIVSVQFD